MFSGLVADKDLPGLDELAKLYLVTGNLDGLAAAAGLLNKHLRKHLTYNKKQNKKCYKKC